ncbi:capsule biosynthesis protein [Thiomicrospira microaerophila]|uniref:capsular polysaccharide export protein, LipB/KpsS family n=1 Tax=Thiomicrospira microaerophila TaxID=406020 RepID=UPI00200FE774|nr:capsule biosynthesis protein [Thiomicrospira microaerophila]UQB43349.1 capsule biosynthesis protein [Thiomicrospira microaerophila]
MDEARSLGVNPGDTLYFWGKKIDPALLAWAQANQIAVKFVEDGFIRSLGLGSALSKPISLVMDSRGIYFDPTGPSDLEHILKTTEFSEELLEQAAVLIDKIQSANLTKYNHLSDQIDLGIRAAVGQRVILVPGQVDDDMSVKFGAFGLNNLSLLEKVREACPDAYIIFKPHPDVLSKNRHGDLPDDQVLVFADQVIKYAGIGAVIAQVDEVHTMTSLAGFDALLRGKVVFCYGLPFYAGWGLTNDLHCCERRGRCLTLEALVAAALVLYPIYLNPKTNRFCSALEALDYMAEQKQLLSRSWLRRFVMRFNGLVFPRIRNVAKSMMG